MANEVLDVPAVDNAEIAETPVTEEIAAEKTPEEKAPEETTPTEKTPAEIKQELKQKLKEFEAREKDYLKKIHRAKENGLTEQEEQYRTLLRESVILKTRLTEHLMNIDIAEKKKEAESINELADSYLNAATDTDQPAVAPSDYRRKAKNRFTAAKIIGLLGVYACLLGGIIYLILIQPEIMNLPFEWKYLIAAGAGAVLFLIISLCIAGSGRFCDRVAAHEEEETARREKEAAEASKLETITANANAYIEAEEKKPIKYDDPDDDDGEKTNPIQKATRFLQESKDKAVQLFKEDPKKAAPIAAATGTALILLTAVSATVIKKRKKNRKTFTVTWH